MFQPTPVQVQGFGEDVEIVHVAAGWSHNLAVTKSGSVYSWGDATRGRLGLGDVSSLPHEGDDIDEVYQPRPTLITGLIDITVLNVLIFIFLMIKNRSER